MPRHFCQLVTLRMAASAGAFFGSIAPRLQPRFYSISSAPAAHPGAVHITCAVVYDTTPSGRTHEGVASFFLKRAAVGKDLAPVIVGHVPCSRLAPLECLVSASTGALHPPCGCCQH